MNTRPSLSPQSMGRTSSPCLVRCLANLNLRRVIFRPICPQKRSTKLSEETLFGITPNLTAGPELQQDEFECLNLNITCPGGLTPNSRAPVMLWIHG